MSNILVLSDARTVCPGSACLSTVPGRFGFPDGAAAEVYVVNANGERVTSGMVSEVREGGRRVYEIRMPSDHFAILVRRGQ